MSDPNVNTQAEIYASIRDKALEEAAKECEKARFRISSGPHLGYPVEGVGEHFATCIRALKSKP